MSGTPHRLPRAPDDWRGELPRTADVLSGALPTYYGPGQAVAAGEPAADSLFGVTPYTPPEEWPGPGTLLRAPQVVHVQSWLPFPWPSPTLTLFRDPGGPGRGDTVYVAAVSPPSLSGLFAACHAAKAAVEALRPGRTWVLHGTGRVDYYPDGAPAWADLVVPRRHAQFLGTDFLRLAYGWPRLHGGGGFNDVLNDQTVPDPYLPGGGVTGIKYGGGFPFLDHPAHLDGVNEVAARAPWFARFAVRLWDLDAYLSFGTRYPDAPTASGPTDVGGDWSGSFVPPPDAAEVLGWQSSVGAHNAELDAYGVDRAHYWRDLATAMRARGLDYEYVGRSSAVTADALVTLIAAHFGFDPDTGRDLPA